MTNLDFQAIAGRFSVTTIKRTDMAATPYRFVLTDLFFKFIYHSNDNYSFIRIVMQLPVFLFWHYQIYLWTMIASC